MLKMGEETVAIGVFWDIENCCVPRYVSALSVVQRVRELFFLGHREAEFMCVCDINKESRYVIEDLNNAQVNVVHINATSKNAADDKLRQSLRRFADTHPPNTKVILISSDVNFAAELSDLRHRKKLYVILIHRRQVHDALIACSNEHHAFESMLEDLPRRVPTGLCDSLDIVIRGYPPDANLDGVKSRLRTLASNCGGRVVDIDQDRAILHFSNSEVVHRARKRLDGEDVFGSKITAMIYDKKRRGTTSSPVKNFRMLGSSVHHRPKSADSRFRNHATSGANWWPPYRRHSESPVPARNGGDCISSKTSVCKMDNVVQGNVNACQQYFIQSTVDRHQRPSSAQQSTKSRRFSRNMLMIQQQHYQEQQEQKSALAVSNIQTCHAIDLSQPPPLLTSAPLQSLGTTASWNISKTVNYTFHHSHPDCHPYLGYSINNPNFGPSPYSVNLRNVQLRSYSRSPTPVDSLEDEPAWEESDDFGGSPVDLYVSNLDYNISSREWRKILAATFQPHVQILGIFVRTQADNTSLAIVKVATVEDARYAIQMFHRRKIGYKRIHVSLRNDGDQAPAENTRRETVAILSDVKNRTIPVFKFIEQYEKRYHKSVSVSDLYKMRDLVEVIDQGGTGRMVRLASQMSPSPTFSSADSDDTLSQDEVSDTPVCALHCPEGSMQYAEALNTSILPSVRLQRRHFAARVHSLLLSHNNTMPLVSFPFCYQAEFGSLPTVKDSGVPLEHLLTCVPGVEIKVAALGVKVIQFQENKEATELYGRSSPILSQSMALISREIVDLLRNQPHCILPASKFIPVYHHHFGRQCRVADYGFTKLTELFDALPHVLQVMGSGDRKILTLSHRAQVKRLMTDLLKVLKSQAGKQLTLQELPNIYERVFSRTFNITNYGVAYLEDMFVDIPPTSILVTFEGNKTIFAIPKRDQTFEEVERTKQFALEVVDLLKHNPQCSMTFSKFIPAYHHHFGRQCRVSDYGFTKLSDLFECISHVVEIVDEEEERMLKLTEPEMRAVLAKQISSLLRDSPDNHLPVEQLMLAFQRRFGFPLHFADYGIDSLLGLLSKLRHCVTVENRDGQNFAVLCSQEQLPKFALRVLQVLMNQSGGCLPLVELCSRYKSTFGEECDVGQIQDKLPDYVQISSECDGSAVIRLTSLQTLAHDIRSMMNKVGSVPLLSFGQTYMEQFSVELKPALYGFSDIPSLLRALPHIVSITGSSGQKYVMPSSLLYDMLDDTKLIELEGSQKYRNDVLGAPVPSAIPSPELVPTQNLPDLMLFEHQTDFGDQLWQLSSEEKSGLCSPLCRTPTSELLQLAASHLPPSPLPHMFPGNVPLQTVFPAACPVPASSSSSSISIQANFPSDLSSTGLHKLAFPPPPPTPTEQSVQDANPSSITFPDPAVIKSLFAINESSRASSLPWQDLARATGLTNPVANTQGQDPFKLCTRFLNPAKNVQDLIQDAACQNLVHEDLVQGMSWQSNNHISGEANSRSHHSVVEALVSEAIQNSKNGLPAFQILNNLTSSHDDKIADTVETMAARMESVDSHKVSGSTILAAQEVCSPVENNWQGSVSDSDKTLSESLTQLNLSTNDGYPAQKSKHVLVCEEEFDNLNTSAAEYVHGQGEGEYKVTAPVEIQKQKWDTADQLCKAVNNIAADINGIPHRDGLSSTVASENVDDLVEELSSDEEGDLRKPFSAQIRASEDGDASRINKLLLEESFSVGPPLDSSSARSGNTSGSSSPYPSPRKTPRRARLAAKFLYPLE